MCERHKQTCKQKKCIRTRLVFGNVPQNNYSSHANIQKESPQPIGKPGDSWKPLLQGHKAANCCQLLQNTSSSSGKVFFGEGRSVEIPTHLSPNPAAFFATPRLSNVHHWAGGHLCGHLECARNEGKWRTLSMSTWVLGG